MDILPAGTELLCPKCKKVMCVSLIDIRGGDILRAASFKSIDGNIDAHRPMECPFYGTAYGLNNPLAKVFTKDGWV